MPLRFWRTYLQSSPQVEPEDFTTCPVWLAHPGADRWTPLPLSQAFFDRIAAPKTLVMACTPAPDPQVLTIPPAKSSGVSKFKRTAQSRVSSRGTA